MYCSDKIVSVLSASRNNSRGMSLAPNHEVFATPMLLDVEPAYKSNIQELLGKQYTLETFKGLRKKDIVLR